MKNLKDLLINEARYYYVDDLAEDDMDWMGREVEHYIENRKCTLKQYAKAGLEWAKDALYYEDITNDEYKEAVEYYKHYEEENNWRI